MKKFLMSILMMFCVFALVGCGGMTESIFMETNLGIYDFYVDNLLSAQSGYKSDLNRLDADNSQKEKVNFAWNGQNYLEVEELAIVSSIECYNLTSIPKECALNGVNGVGLIAVKQVKNHYECSFSKDGQEIKYTFSIQREPASSNYKVRYKQTILGEEKDCSSTVVFDKAKSHLKIDSISYYSTNEETIEKIEVSKNFYKLVNNHTASQINVIFGSGNNALLYSFNIYKQAIDSNIKISKIERKETDALESNLSLDKFAQSTENDICGYIVSYKSTKNKAETKTFGEIDKW